MSKGLLRQNSSLISLLQRVVDGFFIFTIYWIGNALHDGNWDAKRILVATLAVTLFVFFGEMKGLYNSWRTSSLLDEIRAVLSIWAMVAFMLLMLAFSTKTAEMFSRLITLMWFMAAPVALIAVRLVVRRILRRFRRRGTNTRTVAVVGNNPIGYRIVEHLAAMSWSGLVLSGIYDNHQPEEHDISRSTYTLGSIDDLIQKAYAGMIDSVYIALPLWDQNRIEQLLNRFADTTVSVYVVPDLFISGLMHSRWIDFGGMPVVSVFETPFYGLYQWAKRTEDLILGALILLLVSPLMVLIAALIKTTSTGPVLFKQKRYGLNGAVVEVWKFRSMTVCEDGDNIMQVQKGDQRVTPLGAFLRKTSLDELPQFINVLQGSMSIVGPRPHALVHNEQYRQLIKGYMLRHKVKPGITGWAQINGWRGETDTLEKMQKRIEYDLEYIQNWSLWLDLEIIVLTIFRGFTGENAY